MIQVNYKELSLLYWLFTPTLKRDRERLIIKLRALFPMAHETPSGNRERRLDRSWSLRSALLILVFGNQLPHDTEPMSVIDCLWGSLDIGICFFRWNKLPETLAFWQHSS